MRELRKESKIDTRNEEDTTESSYSLNELKSHIISDLTFSTSSDLENNKTSVGMMPLNIYRTLQEIADQINLFEVGHHPDGVWYALSGDYLIWSEPKINIMRVNESCKENETPKESNKFNRYSALTKKH